jgi:hypothetical protein
LIHSDVCGPMSVESVSGFKYFVLFIDDYSRKTWIYFLKAKDEVFDKFQEFRALVENQTGRKIRVLRSDNGGEYTSKEFMDYCAATGIKKELTVPYNPQQNGVAKRKNRTIVGATRAMIHDQGLPLFLWAEASRTAVYIQNRSPHTVLGKLTPEEVFTGTRPDVSHFRIWGSVCYCHVPSEKRTKLDPTTDKGILVGYSEASKAYRIFVPARRKIIVCRDVQFEEERALRRSRDLPTHLEDQQGQDSGVKTEEAQGQSTGSQQQTQGTGSGTSVQRETVGHDHQELDDDEEEQRDAVPQEQGTRPRPKWFKSTVSDSRLAGLPERDFRRSKPPERLGYVALMTQLIDAEPSTYEQAAQHGVWQEAMMEEYASIMKNDVWEVVPRPKGKKVVGSKWIYKVKHAADGSVDKYKARFVAKGFSQ